MKGKSRAPKADAEGALTPSGSTRIENDASDVHQHGDVLGVSKKSTPSSSPANSSRGNRATAADLAPSPPDPPAMSSNAGARNGSGSSKASSGNETADPPVDEYSSDGSASSYDSEGPRRETSRGDFDEEGNDESTSSSRSRSSGSTDDLTGSVEEPPFFLSQQEDGTTPPFRSVDEKGASPLPSTPLRAGAIISQSVPNSADEHELPRGADGDGDGARKVAGEGFDSHVATPASASASPMGPHVRRILEALASFDHGSPDDTEDVGGRKEEELEETSSGASGRGAESTEDASRELRRPPRVKNTARSISASSEASSTKRSQAKKKKARTGYSAPLEDKDRHPFNRETDVEMLDISAIISEVDRQNMDDELDQLVRELDEAMGGGIVDGAGGKGIKLRRKSLRRRGRKGRAASNGKRKKSAGAPTNDPAILNDHSTTSVDDSEDDDDDEEGEVSGSSDPRARAFMNMAAAEAWMAKAAYSSDDSVVETSSCLTFQTEEQAKETKQGPAEDGQQIESPAIKALRDVWNSFTLGPFCDDKHNIEQVDKGAEAKTASAIEPTENGVPTASPEEPQFLEFIDPAFFEELWKALLSIQLQNCRPLELFRSPGPATERLGECSVTSTIPTDAPSFEACDSLSLCSGGAQSVGIDHSAILAKCLARGGPDGDAAGAAGSSPLAKRKAALLLQQCEKKFPSLHKRIIARLESKAGFRSSDTEHPPTSSESGTPQPSPIDSDEDDSLFSTSKVNSPQTNAELANKTPRVRNSRRDNSMVDLSATESHAIDQADQIKVNPEADDVLVVPSDREASVHDSNVMTFAPERDDLPTSQVNETIPASSPIILRSDCQTIQDGEEDLLPSPTDAREYALLTSFTSSAVEEESPPRARTLFRLEQSAFVLENVERLAQGVVSPLTVDSRVLQENEAQDFDGRDNVVAEEGVEVTEILADLTKADSVGWNMPTVGEGRSVTRVKDLLESPLKKVPILTPKSSDTSRPRRVRHSSVPRGIYSDAAFSDVDVEDQFPVVLKHRVLSHAGGDRSATTSRLKPRNLEAFLDRTASPKSSTSTSRPPPYSPDERRSPTSFPSLFSKDVAGEVGITEETMRGDAFPNSSLFSRDDCPEDSTRMVEPTVVPSSLSRSITLPTPSRPSWTKLDTPPRGSLIDSYTTTDASQESQMDEAILGGLEFDLHPQWVAFPTPPRGTFRAELEEDKVPILPTPTATLTTNSFGACAVPVKGTEKPTPTTVRRAAAVAAERSKSSGRFGAARESTVRMLARPRPASATPRARFRRLVSPVPSGKPSHR